MIDKSKPNKYLIKKFVRQYNVAHPLDLKAYKAGFKLVDIFPTNRKFEDVFIKVNYINGAYKTRIGDTTQIAKNILNIQRFDERVRKNDYSLISEIGSYTSRNNNEFNFYSFATKYCHCHNPTQFPIFDKYVRLSLEYYRKSFADAPKFASNSLRDYYIFLEVIEKFKIFSKSEDLSLATIDRFLWAQSKPS